MMSRLALWAIAASFAGAFGGGKAVGDEPKGGKALQEELKRLEGEWRVVAAEMDGEAVETKSVAKFAGEKCTVTDPGSGLPAIELTITLDPSKEPKWMDTKNAQSKTTHQGIYELKGDTLRAVFQPDASRKRPTEFGTKKGSGEVMYTYERVKPK